MAIDTVFCIDGSGNKNAREANLKRPVYELQVKSGNITRPQLNKDEDVESFFIRRIEESSPNDVIVIAADLPIGLPESRSCVYTSIKADTFIHWLEATNDRLAKNLETWREGLIANGVANRTDQKPFVSIQAGDSISNAREKRNCDLLTNGESIYCVDHGGKQVGKAALQFWFEVLCPLRERYQNDLSVWPFEENKRIIIAECYPALCQRMVYGRNPQKQKQKEVASALIEIAINAHRSRGIAIETWLNASMSEDEFDMFTTALAIRETLERGDDLFWSPEVSRNMEGWMLGLNKTSLPATDLSKGKQKRSGTKDSTSKKASPAPGERNRNEQENLGPSGNQGRKGPMVAMVCRRLSSGIECGFRYETNPQDVFQIKCPACQR